MKKRVWSLFLALALCMAMMPMAAMAEETGGRNASAAGGEEDNVHAVAAQTADDGTTSGAETAGGEDGNGSENCTHAQVTQNADNHNYYCKQCSEQMFVQVETKTADSTTTSYGTDLIAAMGAAADGTKITLLADINNTSKYAILTGDGKTVTLDLHGHTINGGWIRVGIDRNGDNYNYTSSILKVVGNGSFKMDGEISVGYSATLDLSGWGAVKTIQSTL